MTFSWLVLSIACLTPVAGPDAGCVGCHTDPFGPVSPFSALGGLSDPTTRGAGAHERHVFAPLFSNPVPCVECHAIPAGFDDPIHIDDPLLTQAEVAWANGVIAGLGASPFDAVGLSCTVYCHGATLTGGSNPVPVWTTPGSVPCGSCHGLPPPPPHPASDSCGSCHSPTASGTTIADPSLHVDGVLQCTVCGPDDTGTTDTTDTGTVVLPPVCGDCHGSAKNPAPPPDLLGQTDTSLTSVGAHDAHVLGTPRSKAAACESCHLVPVGVTDAGHMDSPAPAEVTFGGIADNTAMPPAWNGTTCGNTYCHDQGGSLASPTWTVVDGTQAPCGGCHGLPPPAPHPANSSCENAGCHDAVAGPGLTIIDPSQHVDGGVDL